MVFPIVCRNFQPYQKKCSKGVSTKKKKSHWSVEIHGGSVEENYLYFHIKLLSLKIQLQSRHFVNPLRNLKKINVSFFVHFC